MFVGVENGRVIQLVFRSDFLVSLVEKKLVLLFEDRVADGGSAVELENFVSTLWIKKIPADIQFLLVDEKREVDIDLLLVFLNKSIETFPQRVYGNDAVFFLEEGLQVLSLLLEGLVEVGFFHSRDVFGDFLFVETQVCGLCHYFQLPLIN